MDLQHQVSSINIADNDTRSTPDQSKALASGGKPPLDNLRELRSAPVPATEKLYVPVETETVNHLFKYGTYAKIAYKDDFEEDSDDEDDVQPPRDVKPKGNKVPVDHKKEILDELKKMTDVPLPAWGDIKSTLLLHDSDDRVGIITNGDTQVLICLLATGEVVLAFRGTETSKVSDVVTDTFFKMTSIAKRLSVPDAPGKPGSGQKFPAPDGVKIHGGFLNSFASIAIPNSREGALQDIKSIVNDMAAKHNIKLTKVTCTGHSLGGALATLGAYWCKKVPFKDLPVACYTFGSPRVGNPEFAIDFDMTVNKAYRAVHKSDVVPVVPMQSMGFEHVGVPVLLCQPGLNAYSLPQQVQRSFRRKALDEKKREADWDYVAFFAERPGLHVNADDHNMSLYLDALLRVRNMPGRVTKPPKAVERSSVWSMLETAGSSVKWFAEKNMRWLNGAWK